MGNGEMITQNQLTQLLSSNPCFVVRSMSGLVQVTLVQYIQYFCGHMMSVWVSACTCDTGPDSTVETP